jgi:hypothetical protein
MPNVSCNKDNKYWNKIIISGKRMKTLLATAPRNNNPDNNIKPENPKDPEILLRKWSGKYIRYLNGKCDYVFFEPNITMSHHNEVVCYMEEIRNQIKKHSDTKRVEKIIRIIEESRNTD